MKVKFAISATLLTTLLLTPINSNVTLAGTCASHCGLAPLHFTQENIFGCKSLTTVMVM